MVIPSPLVRRFAEYAPLVAEVAARVDGTLLNLCKTSGYAFTSRVKTIDSLAEKIETGRFPRWSLIDDLYASTVIVPTLMEEPAVTSFCESAFDIISRRPRGEARKQPDVFRFDSTRLWARLRQPSGMDDVSRPSIHNITFEIQVKSAFEHAWSVSTHALGYKAADVDWRRLRLVAQLKAAVEQMDTLVAGFEHAFPSVPAGWWPELDEKKRIADAVTSHLDGGRIPSELRPKDISRFCDNLHAILKSSSSRSRATVDAALDAVDGELAATPVDLVPRSVSLLQYVMGLLLTRGLVGPSFRDYTPHITDDLTTLFPGLKGLSPRFDYDA